VAGPAYQWDGWRFEPTECRLAHDGEMISLPAKTLDVLTALLRRAPRLVTKEELFAAVWPDAAVEEGNIAFHVAALRKVLDASDGTSPIETVRGRGYRFVADVAIAQMPPTDAIQRPVATPDPISPAPSPAPALPSKTGARRIWMAVMTLVIVAAIGAVAGYRWLEAPPPTVVLLPFAFEPDPNRDRYMNTALSYIFAKLELDGFHVVPFTPGPPGEQLREMGARLGVDMALRGSLHEISGGWRVSMQAVRVRDGRQTWNWTFDEVNPKFKPLEAPDDERADLMARIGTRISDGLKLRLADGAN